MEDIGLENTLQYNPYEDETHDEQTFPQLAEKHEPMPEVEDHYIGAEILLPGGDEVARGHEVIWICNTNGNIRAGPIINQFLILRHIKLSSTEARIQNKPSTSLLSLCAHIVMQMVMSTYS